MRIKNLSVKNYKGIESLNVSFNEGVNLLIGNNGAGKTSLLSAISILMALPLGLLKVNANSDSVVDNVRVTSNPIGDTVSNSIPNYPVELSADYSIGNQ